MYTIGDLREGDCALVKFKDGSLAEKACNVQSVRRLTNKTFMLMELTKGDDKFTRLMTLTDIDKYIDTIYMMGDVLTYDPRSTFAVRLHPIAAFSRKAATKIIDQSQEGDVFSLRFSASRMVVGEKSLRNYMTVAVRLTANNGMPILVAYHDDPRYSYIAYTTEALCYRSTVFGLSQSFKPLVGNTAIMRA